MTAVERAAAELAVAREALRAAVRSASDNGVPVTEIARQADVHRDTVHNWLRGN